MAKPYDLGYLGGGQLARMSIQAAQRMGLKCLSLDPAEDSPASQIAASITGALDDPEKIAQVLSLCERVTLENEFIPAKAIESAIGVAGFDPAFLRPGFKSLALIQDKLLQRQTLANAGVPGPWAIALESINEVEAQFGYPVMIKSRFGGYDGKGARVIYDRAELEAAREVWGGGGWLAEAFVRFRRELAILVAVVGHDVATFPTVETVQANQVCDLVYPCSADASEVALVAIQAIGGQGLFGVELFETEDGELWINEIAPRPHNTGHYTLDWDGPSQFEIHVRATMGLPFGEIPARSNVAMANLLGQPGAGDYRKGLAAALAEPSARFHWYGKSESKPGRKMGHLNVVGIFGEAETILIQRAVESRRAFYQAWTQSSLEPSSSF